MHKKLMLKIISCSILFLYASFSIAGEELACAIESSSHRSLNKDVITAILHYCDLHTYNNFLKSCKTIYDTFDVALVTKKNVNQIYFGIDRIIAKHPNTCHTLPDDSYINGLIFYANHQDFYRGPALFNTLLNNASESHKTMHAILLSFFNEDDKKDCIGIYKGKYDLCLHYINAATVNPHAVANGHYLLPFIASIYCTSNNLKRHQYDYNYQGYTNLDLLFNLSVLTEIPTLVQELLNINNSLVNNVITDKNNRLSLLSTIIKQKNITLFTLFLQYDIKEETYYDALTTACEQKDTNVIKLLLEYGTQKNIYTTYYLSRYIEIFSNTNDFDIMNLFFTALGNEFIKKHGSEIIRYAVQHQMHYPELCIQCLTTLLDHYGIDVNSRGQQISFNDSPLLRLTISWLLNKHVKTLPQSIDILKFLLNRDDIDVNITEYSTTAFGAALGLWYGDYRNCESEIKHQSLFFTSVKAQNKVIDLKQQKEFIDQQISQITLLFLNHKNIDLSAHQKAFETALKFDISDDVRQQILASFKEISIEPQRSPLVQTFAPTEIPTKLNASSVLIPITSLGIIAFVLWYYNR